MMRAAMRSDPRDPRYPRLLASAATELKDVDGQIAAWNAYRQLVPEDRVAATRVIELYTWKLDTAEKKLSYLKGPLDNDKLPLEVRAHLASLCVPPLLDRSNDEAIAMVEGGLKLYPLPALLQWEYYLVAKQGTPTDAFAACWDCSSAIRVSRWLSTQSRELAAAGMPEDSAEWFSMEFSIAQRMGVPNDEQFFVNLGSELFLAGQTQAARQWTARRWEWTGATSISGFCC